MNKLVSSCLLVLFVLVLSGCGGDSEFPLVTGTVTLDGKPLENATLEFKPQGSGGFMAYGKTNASGNYDVMHGLSGRGMAAGKYQVKISTADEIEVDDELVQVKEQVPEQYNKKSELSCEVKEGEKNVFDFELASQGKIVQEKLIDD